VTVTVTTFNGTALSGNDYQAKTGTVTFAAGDTSAVFQVTIVGDRNFEPTETFTLVLSNANGAVIDRGTAVVTILDDDRALTVASSPAEAFSGSALDEAELVAAFEEAVAVWAAQGFDTSPLAEVTVLVVDLPDARLGEADADSGVVVLDVDAAGWGWSFGDRSGGVDLVTVLAHELGHLLGLSHDDAGRYPLMAEVLVGGDAGASAATVSARGARFVTIGPARVDARVRPAKARAVSVKSRLAVAARF
jgi:hypothetical protein